MQLQLGPQEVPRHEFQCIRRENSQVKRQATSQGSMEINDWLVDQQKTIRFQPSLIYSLYMVWYSEVCYGMVYSTVQYSIVQYVYITVQYSIVQYSMVYTVQYSIYSTVWYSIVQYIQYSIVQYRIVQVWYGMVWCMVQYSIV